MMKHIVLAALVAVTPIAAQAASCSDGGSSYTAIERVNPNVVYAERGATAIIAVCSMDMAVEATDPGGAEYPAREFATGLNPNNAQYDLTELANLMRSMGLAAQTTPFSSKGCVCATN
ncbi:hypothetical protein [uncultured Maritimibacter sp.]|jgi:hypothetical protein|uniref:hypothetical protein n=1 Tax=uncultured Maritimibacter sp. TaxID=991866 RepID=UPI00261DC214|nr:hypothetical protein [uncultured Maritimibacter sp.]